MKSQSKPRKVIKKPVVKSKKSYPQKPGKVFRTTSQIGLRGDQLPK